MEKEYQKLREFLKSTEWVRRDELETPKDKGKKRPDAVKDYGKEAEIISLPAIDQIETPENSLKELLNKRRSRRKYNTSSLSIDELSYLLWATQGLSEDNIRLRTVPSGGAVHPFETYLYISRVKNMKKGLYRYLPDKHSLILLKEIENGKRDIIAAANGQKFVGKAAVVFLWTVIPKRGEWKYGILSHKLAALDAGHLCENLYLAVEDIKAGMCAVDAYDQKTADKFLEVDGESEFVIYMATVGKVDESERK